MFVMQAHQIETLLKSLQRRGYRTIGPTVQEGAIVFDEIAGARDLPKGWTDEQEKGTYRLKRRADEALFGYAVGPHSWKKFLHPSRRKLWEAKTTGKKIEILEPRKEPPKFAFIGARACDLNAVSILDKVFLEGPHIDSSYELRRKDIFVVAVQCGQAGGTCFCVSMGTGPKAVTGFDIALTEILDENGHRFFVENATPQGAEIIEELSMTSASDSEKQKADDILRKTGESMGRTLDTSGIKDLLYRNLEHPRWDEVATRCLTCANCTMVCPTCFCSTIEDVTDLKGDHTERWQRWDSCFTIDFSHLHGGSVRASTKSRYRQWMTHKLGSWIDQVGTSGCVGCGRCITWCPVGIDITEETKAIRESESR